MKTGLLQAQGVQNLVGEPEKYFQEVLKSKIPATGLFGTGLVYLPQYQYEAVLCMEVVTKFIRQEGLELIEYHDVATTTQARTDLTEPGESYMTQVFIKADLEPEVFEQKLDEVRKKAEHQVHESKLKHRQAFHVGFLSTRFVG